MVDELTSSILRDLEQANSAGVVVDKKSTQPRLKRNDRKKIEDAARARFYDRGSPMYKTLQASSSAPAGGASRQLPRSHSVPGTAMRPGSGVMSDAANGSACASPAGAASRSFASRPTHFRERGFGISNRQEIYHVCKDHLAPGQYDTHNIGTLIYKKSGQESAVSHPGQQPLSHHKSAVICSFGKPKETFSEEFMGLSKPPRLASSPGPGHYNAVNYWDPRWQRYPALGTSLARKVPPPGVSRFGRLAHVAIKGTKSDDDLFRS